MINREVKQNQVHWLLGDKIIVFEEPLTLFNDIFENHLLLVMLGFSEDITKNVLSKEFQG